MEKANLIFLERPVSAKKPPPKRKVARAASSTSSVEEVKPPVSGSNARPVSDKTKVAESSSSTKLPGTPVYQLDEVELYFWENHEFRNQGIFRAHIVKTGTFAFKLCASTDRGVLLAHDVDSSMNAVFNPKLFSFTWNHVGTGGNWSSWLFKFPSHDEYVGFCTTIQRCEWERLHQQSFDKVKEEDQRYVMSSNNEDVEMLDVEDEEEDEEEVLSELDPDGICSVCLRTLLFLRRCSGDSNSEEEEDDEEPYEDEDAPPMTPGEANSQLTVGYKGDHAFVVRGSGIGVFRHNSDSNNLKFVGRMKQISTPQGQVFKPKHVSLLPRNELS